MKITITIDAEGAEAPLVDVQQAGDTASVVVSTDRTAYVDADGFRAPIESGKEG